MAGSLDGRSFTAARNTEQTNESSVNLILGAVILAYLAIAVANTLVAATAARSTEFALPPLVGVGIGLTGSPLPGIPLLAYLGIVGAATALAWCSITIATRSARVRPITAISASRA